MYTKEDAPRREKGRKKSVPSSCVVLSFPCMLRLAGWGNSASVLYSVIAVQKGAGEVDGGRGKAQE
jgi:hypothetical protein